VLVKVANIRATGIAQEAIIDMAMIHVMHPVAVPAVVEIGFICHLSFYFSAGFTHTLVKLCPTAKVYNEHNLS
jgi:hypothetical protein